MNENDIEFYLLKELDNWFSHDIESIDYGIWLMRKLAVYYFEYEDKAGLQALLDLFFQVKRIVGKSKKLDSLKKFIDSAFEELDDMDDLYDSDNDYLDDIDEDGISMDISDIEKMIEDDPEGFFDHGLSMAEMTKGFLSDEFLSILCAYCEVMIKTGKSLDMIETLQEIIDRAKREKYSEEDIFILNGYRVLLYMDFDSDIAYNIEKERIDFCERNVVAKDEMLFFAKEVVLFLQVISELEDNDKFIGTLKKYLAHPRFDDESRIHVLDEICDYIAESFDADEIVKIYEETVASICSRCKKNSKKYLSARRALINLYSTLEIYDKLESILSEDYEITKTVFGKKSREFYDIVKFYLYLYMEKCDGDKVLELVDIIKTSQTYKESEEFRCDTQIFESYGYYYKGLYKEAKKLALLTTFQFMLLDDGPDWVRPFEVVALCEKAMGDVDSAMRHLESILETSLHEIGPDNGFINKITEELESF